MSSEKIALLTVGINRRPTAKNPIAWILGIDPLTSVMNCDICELCEDIDSCNERRDLIILDPYNNRVQVLKKMVEDVELNYFNRNDVSYVGQSQQVQ